MIGNVVQRPRLIALNMKHRRPQHRWTQEERQILCCMKRFFDLKNKDITRVFNYTYGHKIRAEGFSDGLPTSTLAIQWKDLWRKNHNDWHAVHTDVSFEQGPERFTHLIEKIKYACHTLQIGLVARARDLVVLSPQETSYRRVSQVGTSYANDILSVPRHSVILHSPIVDQDAQPNPPPSSHIPRASQASEALPIDATSTRSVPTEVVSKIRSFALGSGNERPHRPSQVPHILWRFSNDESMGINHRSGYIANAFINEIGNIPTPNERVQEFPTWLEIHVRPRKIPSPFISTTTDPLMAVHRALTRDQNAFVSIIDSTQIESESIFYMKDLMKQYNIYTPGYRGAKEYVVWGAICRPAIVTSIRADELVQIANTYPDIKAALQLDTIRASPNCKSQLHNRLALKTFESDFAVGKTVGKFLRLIRLQSVYLEDVSKSLNTSWSLTISDDTTEFIRGVNEGFHTTIAPLSPVNVPENTFHSQETTIRSQDESPSDNITQQVAQDIDLRDYVIVDDPQQEDIAHDIRQSMDRFSIDDDAENFSDHQLDTAIQSLPEMATTIATRRISVFEPASEAWVTVPETQCLTPPGVVESVENGLPASSPLDDDNEERGDDDADDDDDGETVKVKTELLTTPTLNHTRSYSESSDSTIGNQTPASKRFSEERSHVKRVLNYDWPTFWDSLHQAGSQ